MSAPPQPSFAELVSALKALSPPAVAPAPPPAPAPEVGMAKHAGAIVASLILAIFIGVGSMVLSLSTGMAKVSTQLATIESRLDEIGPVSTDVATLKQTASNNAANITRLDARVSAIEAARVAAP